MSITSARLFMTRMYDKTAAAVTAAELEGFEPTGDPSLTFQDVADSGCPYTQQLLVNHPELADQPYDETIMQVHGVQPQALATSGGGGGGFGMPMAMISGGLAGAAVGGAVGDYLGNKYDSLDPRNAALIGAGVGGIGGAAGGWLLDRWLDS